MSNRKLDCDIVCDLLPLYHDGIVSKTTGEAVKEHLELCGSCQKEYETICVDVPIEAKEMTTKKKFANTMKTFKRKRLLLSAIAVVLICSVVIGGYFLQLQIPMVNIPESEITVHSAYRYETEEGYKLFVLYSSPCYNHTKVDMSLESIDSEEVLVLEIKKPLFSQRLDGVDIREEVYRYEYGYSSGDNGELIFTDFDRVQFAGNIIWSKKENASEDIPEYVYAYEDLEEPGGNVMYWGAELKAGYIGAGYTDGSFVSWDLDGNVINQK